MENKISVIVPIYNSEKTLRKTLNSIINQTYKALEIILINDGSTDNSYDVCMEYLQKDNRIVLLNQKNKGVGEARNFGIDFCTGNYISFVDSDDTINLDYFAILLREIKKNNLDIVGSNICVVTENDFLYPYEKNGNIILHENKNVIEQYLEFKISTAVWGKLYKRDLIGKIRFPKININEDFIFGWEIMKKCKSFLQVNSTHYKYFSNTQNSLTKKTFSSDNMSIIEHANKVFCDVCKFYPNLLLKGKNYFNACVLHNLLIYYDYIKKPYLENLYVEEKLIMEKLLAGQKKLDYCFLLHESFIEIDKLIEEINNIIAMKGGDTKCL